MRVRQPVSGSLVAPTSAGGWKLYARRRNGGQLDLTNFRGVPSVLGDFSLEDPFGPKQGNLVFPTVSYHERRGIGDLDWARKGTSLDLVWTGSLPASYARGRWRGPRGAKVWVPSFSVEGYIDDFSYDESGMTVLTKGAGYQLDNYLAKPEYPQRPMPYEHALAMQFLNRPHLRLSHLQIEWPSWWNQSYTPGWVDRYYKWAAPAKNTESYLIPTHVTDGDNWTGMVTRDTGNWEPVLTSYIQRMLAGMYTRQGRWTMDFLRGRLPILQHRTIVLTPTAGTVVVDLANPLVKVTNLNENGSQAVDVIYASGTTQTGQSYSGMEVTNDGQRTYYNPMAAARQAWPTKDNDWLDFSIMPREIQLQVASGLDENAAEQVAQSYYERFGDPGFIIDLELTGDVKLHDGSVLPAAVIAPGMPIQIKSLWGRPNGPLAHITAVSTNLVTGKTRVTADSRWRDQLTVAEVKQRGKDAMNISRMLTAGQYSPPLPDQLLPWDYSEGSGQIPRREATRKLFDGMPNDLQFPWTDWTTAHPPSDPKWQDAYIRIGPAATDWDNNWSGRKYGKHKHWRAIPIRMAQKGTVRLIQIAAYDASGNVMPVPFHVSFWYMMNTSVQAMPKITSDVITAGFGAGHDGEHSPWVPDAWETYNSDGTQKASTLSTYQPSAALWQAFGNSNVKAGYFPGDGSGASPTPTGEFVDETTYPFDTTPYEYAEFDPYKPHGNHVKNGQGLLYVMFYCDAQGTSPVYFLGRMFRSEPGAQIGGN